MSDLKIHNVKISISLDPTIDVLKKIKSFSHSAYTGKKRDSYYVFRDEFVYIIYFSGHINCTKIRRLEDVFEAVNFIVKVLNITYNNVKKIKIDNIFASARISSYLSLRDFANFMRKKDYRVQLNLERFPGLSIRMKEGGFLSFKSGKIILNGVKSEKKLQEMFEKIKQYYIEYKTTL